MPLSKGNLIAFGGDNPRACIFATNDIKHVVLARFCSRDCVAVEIQFKREGKDTKFIAVSCYLPYDSPEAPPTKELKEIVDFAQKKNTPIVIGMDANSHHLVWGSSNNNVRGESLLEYIAASNLDICNQGNEPTFINAVRREVIDLTLTSSNMEVDRWRVSGEDSASDHRYITFELAKDACEEVKYRNPKCTDWEKYRINLRRLLNRPAMKIRTGYAIEKALKYLEDAIIKAFHEACPQRKVTNRKPIKWWNRNLERIRTRLGRQFNKARKTGDWSAHAETQKEYKAAINEARLEEWQNFCEELENVSEVSRLRKALERDPRAKLEVLRKPDGDFTMSSEETLDLLIQTHFPECTIVTEVTEDTSDRNRASAESFNYANQMVTREKVRWAIKSFSPYKSPGPDGIYPVLLQEGFEVLEDYIRVIYRACIATGYMPVKWRIAKVVFLPKPGKSEYDNPKSFRTISLTSFLLKGLEKLVDVRLKETSLAEYPLDDRQHAYQKGKSGDTAMIELASKAYDSIERGEFAVAVFLDVEGAFDRPLLKKIEEALEKRRINQTLKRWILSLLSNRFSKTEINGVIKMVRSSRGFAQGGVLSTTLWNIVVDSLLESLNSQGYFTIGYADDLCVLIRGKFLSTVLEQTQNALKIVEAWCTEQRLSVNPQKTEMMLFTRKRKLPEMRLPALFGTQLKLSDSVKYLGVIFDTKLSFKQHLDTRIRKATMILWQCRRAFGRTWGLSPNMVNWIFTAIVRPYLSYGVIVWWPRIYVGSSQKMLNKLQRLACMSITGVMRTTPTAALEVLFNLPPLHLYLEAEAGRSLCRVNLVLKRRVNYGSDRGSKIQELIDSITGDLQGDTDTMVPKLSFGSGYGCSVPERTDWELREWIIPNSIEFYTDGSLINDLAGAGIYEETIQAEISIPLGSKATVFQAEIYAIYTAANIALEKRWTGRSIYFHTDSQAAIGALSSSTVSSSLVERCRRKLNELGRNNYVVVDWIPGHTDIPGNEKADLLARTAVSMTRNGEPRAIKWSYHLLKNRIGKRLTARHKQCWESREDCRQAKMFAAGPSSDRTRFLLSLKRHDIRTITGILTGHCPLMRHMKIIKASESSTCPCCLEEDETVEHYLCSCPAFSRIRWRVFGVAELDSDQLLNLDPKKILDFAKKSGRFNNQEH